MPLLIDLHMGVLVYLSRNLQKHNLINQDRLGYSNVMVINNMNILVFLRQKLYFILPHTSTASEEGMERAIFRAKRTCIQILAPLGTKSRRKSSFIVYKETKIDEARKQTSNDAPMILKFSYVVMGA